MATTVFNSSEVLNSIDNSSLMLHLTGRKSNSELFSITPTVKSNVQQDIINLIEKQIEFYSGQSLKTYDIVGALDNVVEVAKLDDFNNEFHMIVKSLGQPNSYHNIDPNDFDFFTYEMNDKKGNPIYIFRRINRMKALKKGILGRLQSGIFSQIKSSNLLGIDNAIDFLVFNDQIFIFHHISLERVLKLKDKFKTKAEEVLSNSEFTKKIKNFDNLKEKALENGNYVKRLAKLHGDKGVTAFLDKIDKTKAVIDQFDLDIEVSNGQLIYRDDTQIGNFVNLMQDSYYRTLIGEQNGIDEKR